MEKENQLDRIDASVSNFGNTMMQTTECFNSLNELTGNLVSAANNYIDLQRDMHKMDVQFNAYVATLDAELERHKRNLPVVERQLNQINQMMDKVLDKVLSMDANTDIEMDMKMKYMETLQTFTDKIATMMIKLL